MSSEWGIGEQKGGCRVLSHSRRLHADHKGMRVCMWKSGMRVHNLRERMMKKGAIRNVFLPDDFEIEY